MVNYSTKNGDFSFFFEDAKKAKVAYFRVLISSATSLWKNHDVFWLGYLRDLESRLHKLQIQADSSVLKLRI